MAPLDAAEEFPRSAVTTTLLRAVVALVSAASVLIVTCGWLSSSRAVHPARAEADQSLSDYPMLRAEPVSVLSPTGARLSARFFPGRQAATVVLTHGYGASQDEM